MVLFYFVKILVQIDFHTMKISWFTLNNDPRIMCIV
jgi:hypothetical protein